MATKKRLFGLTLLLATGMALAGCMGDDTESTGDDGLTDDGGLGTDAGTNGDAGTTNDTGTTNGTTGGNQTDGEPVVAEGEAPQAPPTFPPTTAANPDGAGSS